MSELKYDPDFPYVLVNVRNEEHTRWANKKFAERFLKDEWGGYGRVIDTTPKPKIPDDAEFIFVEDGDQSVFAYRIVGPGGENLWMMAGNGAVTTEELLEYIGDAPVIVMVEREDA